MRYLWTIFSGLVMGGMLTSCSLTAQSTAVPGTPSLPAYQTVAVMLSETAQVDKSTPGTASPAPSREATLEPSVSPTITPKISPSVLAAEKTATPDSQCDLAQAGIPIDVTIPDDSLMQPGQQFTKTWRLLNAGTCAWTKEYALVWFSGDDLSQRREEFLRAVVQPGGTAELSVDMTAPNQAGVYQSNWKLRSPKGSLFGIGPGGSAPFWVRIEVAALTTLTPTVTVTQSSAPTATVEVLNDGFVTLMAPQAFDLESALTDTVEEDDLSLWIQDGNLNLEPVNGAEWANFGNTPPSLSECLAVQKGSSPVQLGADMVGRYYCVRTNLGFTGYIHLARIDTVGSEVDMNFVTWAE